MMESPVKRNHSIALTEPESDEAEEVILSVVLVETLEGLLGTLRQTAGQVPRFSEAALSIDLEGRCVRLRNHLRRLSECSPTSQSIFEEDLIHLQSILGDWRRLIQIVHEAKMAPEKCWDRWLKSGGKYARRMARLNNKLNDAIADHILHVNIKLPEKEGCKGFPPTIEEMKLSLPSTSAEEDEPKRWSIAMPRKGTGRLSTSDSSSTVSTMLSSSLRSSRSSRSHCPITSIHNNSMDTSMSSIHSHRSSAAGDCMDYWNNASTATFHSMEESGLPRLHWDLSPRNRIQQGRWWGSSSNVSKSRKDRTELYVKTQVLRDMPQDIAVRELRIVLAQLEAGDTSPGVVAGRAVMMAVGAVGALMVSPLVVLGGFSAKEAVTQTPLEAAAVFSHYLIEFELDDGTIGTLENCVEDIYLYAGRSSRQNQHTVARIPMTPGYLGSPDSLVQPLLLQDLVRFRNQQRRRPYQLWDNNCKHFVFSALTGGELFPKATNYEEESLDVFFALCQGCYVQKDQFAVFTESHNGERGKAELARRIMTLWERGEVDVDTSDGERSEEEKEDGDDNDSKEQEQCQVEEEQVQEQQDPQEKEVEEPANVGTLEEQPLPPKEPGALEGN